MGGHAVAAMLSGIEHIQVDEAESLNLARALLDVASKRKLKPNPEVLAWGNLLGVVAMLYGPRLIAFLADQQKRRAAREAEKQNEAILRGVDASAENVTAPN